VADERGAMPVSASEFTHPTDAAALQNLKQIPLFDSCVKAFLKLGIERYLHNTNMANNIRLSSRQLPDLYKHLPEICKLFGIEEPELYLEMNPFPNAYTMGDKRVFICVTSGLLELMNEKELHAVLAHECGHIACHHVLYHTMALMLISGTQMFLPIDALAEPIRLALMYWNRRSELSADRAGAVAVGGPEPIVTTMIRLAGGPRAITDKVDVNVYMEQAAEYDKLSEGTWDKFMQTIAISHADHPFLAIRVREISKWAATDHFQYLVSCIKQPATGKCAKCGSPIGAGWQFCNSCGATIG
jgi:Zn-dependent protease with chaperone function